MIEVGVLLESPAQQLKPKAQLSLSPQLSSKLSNEAQVRLSSVGHYLLGQVKFPNFLRTPPQNLQMVDLVWVNAKKIDLKVNNQLRL